MYSKTKGKGVPVELREGKNISSHFPPFVGGPLKSSA